MKIIFLSLFTTILFASTYGFPKEYYKITNVAQMKQYFFNFLAPLVKKENQKVLKEREFVIKNFNKYINKDKSVIAQFQSLQKKYKIKNKYSLKEYLCKIDIVPPSQVLAQAAIESGWGKSRFVKEANNIFGHWTWKDKGLIPEKRDKGKTHKIKIFNSLEESIAEYIHNLNIGWAYKDFRRLRALLRKHNTKPNGILLLRGLKKYSTNKNYENIVFKMIIKNKLAIYDGID